MSDCVIEFDNVKFEYQTAKRKERAKATGKFTNFSLNIDKLRIEKGQVYVIIGGNGVGKSTLSKLMCGILKAKSGKVLLDGENIDNFSLGEIGRKISCLFQEPKKQLFTTNVLSEMTFVGEMLGLDVEVVKTRAEMLLEKFNLFELKDRSVYRLSRGEAQRLAFASLLMNDLDFLILDEPTTGLDNENREILFDTIDELCKNGMGIAIVSHDAELIERFGENRIELVDGKVVDEKVENSNATSKYCEKTNEVGKKKELTSDSPMKRNVVGKTKELTAYNPMKRNEVAVVAEAGETNELTAYSPIKRNEVAVVAEAGETKELTAYSPIKRNVAAEVAVDPRTKLFAIVLMTTLAVIFQSSIYMGILAAVSLVVTIFLGGNLFTILRKLKRFVSLLIAVSIAQIVFRRTGQPLWTIGDFVVIYLDGVTFGISTALRFFIILCSASVMVGESSKKVMTALSKMKIPYTFIFMTMIALRFLPTFQESFKDSLTAIQLRGIDIKKIGWSKKIKLYSSLILPVVATAIVNSQDLAMAAEARGFSAMRTRTELVDVKMRVGDYFAMLAFAILFGIIAVLYYL